MIGALLISMVWGALFTMPVFFIALFRRSTGKYQKKKYDEAIKDGVRVCQAEAHFKRIKSGRDQNDHYESWYVYEFEFEEKKYKYKTKRDLKYPVIVKFFDENPKGAVVGDTLLPRPKDPMVGTIATFIIMTALNFLTIVG